MIMGGVGNSYALKCTALLISITEFFYDFFQQDCFYNKFNNIIKVYFSMTIRKSTRSDIRVDFKNKYLSRG